MMTTNHNLGLGALTALLALCVPRPVQAGDITGRLVLEAPTHSERVVVYLEDAPPSEVRPSAEARLSQKGARFSPAVLPVLKGTTVDLTNDDRLTHSVFSKSDTQPFDFGLYAKGDRKALRFEAVGAVDVFCSIHPKMKATILVLPNPYFTQPSEDGTFTLKGVPPGSYRLAIYRAGEPLKTMGVKVPRSGTVNVAIEKATVHEKG